MLTAVRSPYPLILIPQSVTFISPSGSHPYPHLHPLYFSLILASVSSRPSVAYRRGGCVTNVVNDVRLFCDCRTSVFPFCMFSGRHFMAHCMFSGRHLMVHCMFSGRHLMAHCMFSGRHLMAHSMFSGRHLMAHCMFSGRHSMAHCMFSGRHLMAHCMFSGRHSMAHCMFSGRHSMAVPRNCPDEACQRCLTTETDGEEEGT